MTDDVPPALPSLQKFVPVCAIGASAGGVAALQGLFRQLPDDLGLAYVAILHLSPDQPSALSEILAGCTRMPVLQILDGPTLQPNCVYVIPPDRELVIEGDSVTARPFTEPRGQRAPIDMFFRSVAAARGDGIAMVLSGAGADGAMGVRAIKEAGGVIMVQEPAEAGFASMPQNAIATGAADFIAPLARLAERLREVAHSKEAVRSLDMDGSANDLRRIVAFVRGRTGHDFSSYKRATVMRRVVRRMQVCRTDTLADYADYLLATPEEAKELFSDLLISVTQFFRDPRAFEALERHAIRPLFDELNPDSEDKVRAWVVGCATGEEAYSLAILLHEEALRRKLHPQVQIFASDLDEGALATAREGRYTRAIEADVSEERLARFFIDEGTHYRVRKELRESVLFASHSVIKEPPFMRLDLITCRNLLIYLERSLQQQLCSIFHYGLKPGRYLFLGSAETADAAADLFAPLEREARIYCSRPHAAHPPLMLPAFAVPERLAPAASAASTAADRTSLPASLHAAALERSAPASALVDDGQNILHLSPNAGRFILHSSGPISNSLPAIVRPELRLDLRLALTRALDARETTLTHPTIVSFEQGKRRVAMSVAPVPGEDRSGSQAIVFFLDGGAVLEGEEPAVAPDTRPDEVRRLHAELKAAQEALVGSRTAHEAAVQDLRATNEELQSINEEYRSTAEELETSKEELQSINEELHTVNAELKSKLSSISTAHSDLQNLTSATEIGTLFLDADLRIKMFTPAVIDLFNVTKADIGRPITDFTHRLDFDGLENDARRVLSNLAPVESEVRSRDGRWYVMRMRPYRTVENRIEGTVVSFVDITARRQAELALRESEAEYRHLFNSIGEGFCVIELLFDDVDRPIDYRFVSVNAAFEQQTGLRDVIGRTAKEMVPDLEAHWFDTYGRIVRTGQPERFEDRADALGRWYEVYAFPAGSPDSNQVGVLFKDVIARKRTEEALKRSEERFRAFVTASTDVVYRMSPDWSQMLALEGQGFLIDTAAPSGTWLDTYIEPGEQPRVAAAIGEAIRTKGLFELEHRVRRADGSVGWTMSRAVPIVDERGEITEWFGAASDVTARVQALAALRASETRQRALIEGVPQLVWRAVDGGDWTWSSPQWLAYTGQSEGESLGRGWLNAIHPDDREAALAEWQEAERTGVFQIEYRICHAAERRHRWFQSRATPVRGEEGGIVEWLGTSTDVDDLRAMQERQQVMVAELQHRTRNLLGVVRSISGQTVRASATLPEFEAAFNDRLAALSRVQGLLSRAANEPITVNALIETELDALGIADMPGRLLVEGPSVRLRKGTVQTLALALHELATNARKYGAFATPDGSLRVTWCLREEGTEERLALEWRETGLDRRREDQNVSTRQGGYGRELIEQALPYALRARTRYEVGDTEVLCTIDLPLAGSDGAKEVSG